MSAVKKAVVVQFVELTQARRLRAIDSHFLSLLYETPLLCGVQHQFRPVILLQDCMLPLGVIKYLQCEVLFFFVQL